MVLWSSLSSVIMAFPVDNHFLIEQLAVISIVLFECRVGESRGVDFTNWPYLWTRLEYVCCLNL